MFAKNNQISGRQAMRLMTFDLLGYSALMIPAALAADAGKDGVFSLILGIGGGFLYLRLLKSVLGQMSGNYSEYLTQTCGIFLGGILKVCYIFYFLLLAGRVASVFAELVVKELLEKQFHLILFVILLLALYGVMGGIEGRARVYEILFWIVLIPLFAMMLFTIPTVDTDYWMPIFRATKSGVLRGSYRTFFGCSILFLMPFLAEYVRDKEHLYRSGKKALCITGVILCLLYLILLGMFGSNALATIDYPVVTMMSRVQITGGFLKRVDAIMFGIWFFTLFALLNSLLFFCGRLWMDFAKPIVNVVVQKLQPEDMEHDVAGTEADMGEIEAGMKKAVARISVVVETLLVFWLASWFYQSEAARTAYEQFFWYVGTPFVVLVPVLLCLLQKAGIRNLKNTQKGGSTS